MALMSLAVIVFPFVAGYIMGCRHTDPESYRGKIYYSNEVD